MNRLTALASVSALALAMGLSLAVGVTSAPPAGAAGVAGAAAHADPGSSARTVIKPNTAMVNQTIKVHGTGFKPSTRFTIEECSRTNWFVPQNPCADDNSVTVKTGSMGNFRASMVAKLCPMSSSPGRTEDTCYIGEPIGTGVDTIALRGHAKLRVTWP